MFPRYIFLRPTHSEQSIAPIRSTPGVSMLVRFGIEVAKVDNVIIEELRRIEAKHLARPDSQVSPFVAGEPVQVADGPLLGLKGIVTRPALERVSVLLNLLGREKEVIFTPDVLRKID